LLDIASFLDVKLFNPLFDPGLDRNGLVGKKAAYCLYGKLKLPWFNHRYLYGKAIGRLLGDLFGVRVWLCSLAGRDRKRQKGEY